MVTALLLWPGSLSQYLTTCKMTFLSEVSLRAGMCLTLSALFQISLHVRGCFTLKQCLEVICSSEAG